MKIKIINDTIIHNVDVQIAIGIGNDNMIKNSVGKFDPNEKIISRFPKLSAEAGLEIPIKTMRDYGDTIKFKRGVINIYQLGADQEDITTYEINKSDCIIINEDT